uniref:Leptin receptor gene-related protein n=1 Tax=Parastrongyloides trichosuri TaxID=131310 RepID=A0A0N4Z531_PARTI
MTTVRNVAGIAFALCAGLTLLTLACTIPHLSSWWPMFVVIFYILSPIPIHVAKAFGGDLNTGNPTVDFAIFVTTGIIVSAFGLPAVLAHVGQIQFEACIMTSFANIIIFSTIIGYFYYTEKDTMAYPF